MSTKDIDNIPLSPIRIPKQTNENEEKAKTYYTDILSFFIDCFYKKKESD